MIKDFKGRILSVFDGGYINGVYIDRGAPFTKFPPTTEPIELFVRGLRESWVIASMADLEGVTRQDQGANWEGVRETLDGHFRCCDRAVVLKPKS